MTRWLIPVALAGLVAVALPAPPEGARAQDKPSAKPKDGKEPAEEAVEKTSAVNVLKVLDGLGFELRGEPSTMTINTNIGSWTFTTYRYANKKTKAELKLVRDTGLLGLAGPRWRIEANEAKAQEAVLALAKEIDPDLKKACDEALAEIAKGKKAANKSVGEKPKLLRVGVVKGKLSIETDPPPSLIYP